MPKRGGRSQAALEARAQRAHDKKAAVAEAANAAEAASSAERAEAAAEAALKAQAEAEAPLRPRPARADAEAPLRPWPEEPRAEGAERRKRRHTSTGAGSARSAEQSDYSKHRAVFCNPGRAIILIDPEDL